MPTFENLQEKWPRLFGKKNPPPIQKIIPVQEQRIKELKDSLKIYIKTNNKLVSEIWDIDLKLVRDASDVNKEALMERKTFLLNQIEQNQYEKKINELREEITSFEEKEVPAAVALM